MLNKCYSMLVLSSNSSFKSEIENPKSHHPFIGKAKVATIGNNEVIEYFNI
jgi:hypothetical protein